MNKRFAFIGAGNMAQAIIKSFVKNKAASASDIIAFDIDPTKYDAFSGTDINFAKSTAEAIAFADYVFLAVKPQFMNGALDKIKESAGFENKVYISIAAGISTDYITRSLGKALPVVRTMPNTPFLVGKGAIAISRNTLVSDEDFDNVCEAFKKVATVAVFDEKKMNAIVSVNGSSPAYVFKFVRAMLEGAKAQGFDEDDVRELVLRSIEGSVEMIRSTNMSIQSLIDMVTSKKGTTEQAILSLNRDDFEGSIVRAMLACTERAEELAKGK